MLKILVNRAEYDSLSNTVTPNRESINNIWTKITKFKVYPNIPTKQIESTAPSSPWFFQPRNRFIPIHNLNPKPPDIINAKNTKR